MAAKTKAQLEAELAQLTAENSALKSGVDVSETAAAPSKTARRWRAFTATVLVSVGVLLAPAAVVGTWAERQLQSTEAFVATFAPLASDPDVQQYIGDEVVKAIESNVDIAAVTGDVFDGLEGLGLPDAAKKALGLLEGPATEGIKSLISGTVHKVVSSDAFSAAVTQALTLSHEQMLAVLQGDPGTTVVLGDNGTIGIATGPLIDSVKASLVKQGIGIANAIPTINTTIVVAQNDQLALLRPAYQLSVAVGNGLPWVALAFVLVGIVIAVNRRRSLFGASLALGVMFTSLAAGFGIGKLVFIASISPKVMPSNVAETLFDQLTERMSATAAALAALTFGIAAVTWFLGLASGRKYRTAAVDAAAFIRTAANERGITTGAFGGWLFRFRTVIRFAIAVVAAIIIVTAWPVSIAGIIWTLVLSLLAVFLLELLMRPQVSAAAS